MNRLASKSNLQAAGLSAALAVMLCAGPGAAQWIDGNDDDTGNYGRFGGWPQAASAAAVFSQYYEDDLIWRVHPDRVERSHKDLQEGTWTARFGWADRNGASPASVADFADQQAADGGLVTTDVRWTRKTFSVRRQLTSGEAVGDTPLLNCGGSPVTGTYLVTVNGVGPGTWIESDLNRFYVKWPMTFHANGTQTGFSHICYVTTQGNLAMQPIDGGGIDALNANWDRASTTHNWILLIGEQNDLAPFVILPLMISYPPLGAVTGLSLIPDFGGQKFYLCFEFAGSVGTRRTVALSMPFGANQTPG